MDMKVKVEIEAPGIVEAILALADTLQNYKAVECNCNCKEKTVEISGESIGEKDNKTVGKNDEINVKEKNRRGNKKQEEVINENENGQAEKLKEEKREDKVKKVKVEQAVSLEEVRSFLIELSRNGKQSEVKGILNSLGFKKLTDVPKELYLKVLEEAKELNG